MPRLALIDVTLHKLSLCRYAQKIQEWCIDAHLDASIALPATYQGPPLDALPLCACKFVTCMSHEAVLWRPEDMHREDPSRTEGQ